MSPRLFLAAKIIRHDAPLTAVVLYFQFGEEIEEDPSCICLNLCQNGTTLNIVKFDSDIGLMAFFL